MNTWRELKTLQEVAEAQKNGEEIEYKAYPNWEEWAGKYWEYDMQFRSRPAKKTKTVVLREALMLGNGGYFWTTWYDAKPHTGFVRWLDTPERIVEITE